MQEKNREQNQKNAQKEPTEQKNQKTDRKYSGSPTVQGSRSGTPRFP